MKYRKTELGQQTFKDRNTALSTKLRSALILFDGSKDDSLVLSSLAVMGLVQEDIQTLVQQGLIEAVESSSKPAPLASSPPAQPETASTMSDQDRYKQAYPVATRLTSGLGLRGFRLNLSLESAGSYQDLIALAPKIREAVGDEKFAELQRALKGF
jgi:hypothetical protein